MRFKDSKGAEHGPPGFRMGPLRLMLGAMVVIASVMTSSAKAESVEVRLASVTPLGPNWQWTYRVELTPGNFVSNNPAGDALGMFDVDGYVTGSASFAPVAALGTYLLAGEGDASLFYDDGNPLTPPQPPGLYETGSPNPFLNGAADLALTDFWLDYTGPNTPNPGGLNLLLGFLTFTSTINTGVIDLAYTTDTQTGSSPPGTGRFQEVLTPRIGGDVLAPTPVASMGGAALFGIVGAMRIRRRNAQVA